MVSVGYDGGDEKAHVTTACKGRRCVVRISEDYFYKSPITLETYREVTQTMFDADEDRATCDHAADQLYRWALRPFEDWMKRLEQPTYAGPFPTLAHYLDPPEHRWKLYVVEEVPEPFLDYDVPPRRDQQLGVWLPRYELHPDWRLFKPEEILASPADDDEEELEKPPTMVWPRSSTVAGDMPMCYFKPLQRWRWQHAVREMETYKALHEVENLDDLRVPRVCGVVMGDRKGSYLGLLISYVENAGTLESLVGPEMPLDYRRDFLVQLTETLDLLHELGLTWGDARPSNVLIDPNDGAWVVDFGGAHDESRIGDWVSKRHLHTPLGDREGLYNITRMLMAGIVDMPSLPLDDDATTDEEVGDNDEDTDEDEDEDDEDEEEGLEELDGVRKSEDLEQLDGLAKFDELANDDHSIACDPHPGVE
ncbi:hypothetical protein BO86DRAFT_319772 [Aspergillus japonicus CBS 114.51]|uniref:Protein kinase domain-containing protein n=1 Tax=Aspergillus japonicus CBS 114.51 TaxID=1448312 RepID=A0A8T8WSZ5_ASPJA|nr:hypothetical protein BO86DRAFT_319772 [Aspergillus japonicus CBS 114.51]RAH78863.1 hypothetical protein BO86DRAFT_319772 [Aspergillus japonicus CBS 114.51]